MTNYIEKILSAENRLEAATYILAFTCQYAEPELRKVGSKEAQRKAQEIMQEGVRNAGLLERAKDDSGWRIWLADWGYGIHKDIETESYRVHVGEDVGLVIQAASAEHAGEIYKDLLQNSCDCLQSQESNRVVIASITKIAHEEVE